MPKKSEDSLDTSWIEAFIATVEKSGFENAATHLGCSQSTITTRVAKLESWVGFSLFDRSERSAKLNNRGHLIYQDFKYILKEVYDVRNVSMDKFDKLKSRDRFPKILNDWVEFYNSCNVGGMKDKV